ncbi:MAG TPA: glycosyl hydrolase 115 family protein [Vicinamibacterales bacterium]|nr:glycosyl hydrolase 115 family protein [Vicinamibacterales bacterium]
MRWIRWLAATLLCASVLVCPDTALAVGGIRYVDTARSTGAFPLVQVTGAASLAVDPDDWPGVLRAARDLRDDVNRVTGLTPELQTGVSSGPVVIIGTVGKSRLIDRLIKDRKIDVSDIAGKWESFFLQTVADPLPGVAQALVIAGSDKRGTIYGIYDLSEQIGVSPWYWWQDAAPDRQAALFVRAGRYRQGEPSVKYRGIFLNDEDPNLTRWVRKTYGERPSPADPTAAVANYNSQFYARIFEVILRLKGNYLWPAMWNNAFAEDDPANPRLADEYGIVMGTSHQEPMGRAQREWDWHLQQEHGNWNYARHPEALDRFWREGVRARKDYEAVYTIGLRGQNDTAMANGFNESIALLEQIVASQRKTLADEVTRDVTKVPQVWTLYKEVQNYYEAGLRVPDDVTLLWAEDNWGNVRRLPTADERKRSGGAGVYYHFDYHGGPRSYQWINTNPIAKIWEQMSLARTYGADRIWIVNVGHFKAYAFPTEYFLDLAWDSNRWTHDNIGEYTRLWAEREFGRTHAAEIADIISKYSKYNGRRKPELLEARTYSLVNHREWERIVEDYDAIAARAEALYAQMPPHKADAFYQLVLFPAKASALVNRLYFAAARNALYAQQRRASTNDMARLTRELFQADAGLMTNFNKVLAGGKWDHFQDQAHIGYTSWRDPPENNLNAIRLTEIEVPAAASLGVAVDGSALAWPGADGAPALPRFDALSRGRHYVDVFNRGATPFTFSAVASAPWIVLSEQGGDVRQDRRLWVSVDWARAPRGTATGTIVISGAGREVVVAVEALKPGDVTRESLRGFAEGQGFVSIEPEHFTRRVDAGASRWLLIEDYGRTLSGMRADAPVDAVSVVPGKSSPVLEYRMHLFTAGETTTTLILSPTLNFVPGRGLRVAVSFDDTPPQIVTIVPDKYDAANGNRDWEESVRNNARVVSTTHTIPSAGVHTLKIWMVDPAVVVQKIVVESLASRRAATYLGPPESYRSR